MDNPAASVAPPNQPEPAAARAAPLHGAMVLIYDGRCGFCRAQSRRLVRLARPGAITLLDAHAPGALDPFRAEVTMDQAMAAVQLVKPPTRPGARPRIYRGAEAVARALATRRIVGPLALIYYLPLLRQLSDAAYRLIARNRYRISRWWPGASAQSACEGGACRLDHK